MIQAIETKYAGCRFRSRLEARWAVFFDALGIEWQFEPQGFETKRGRYLPDFFLPVTERPLPEGNRIGVKREPRSDVPMWIEVKGALPPKEAAFLSTQFAMDVDDTAAFAFLVGDIPRDKVIADVWSRELSSYVTCHLFSGHKDAVRSALETARSARFEYGETPVPR